MSNDEPEPEPPPEDPIQSALDAVERTTGEKLAENDDDQRDDKTET